VEEDLPGRAAWIEQRMKAAFAEMATRHEVIGDVRGRGVLLGLELVTDRERKTAANEVAAAVERRCLEAGLILQLRGTGPGRKNVLRLVPPITTTEAEIDRALSIIDAALAGAEAEYAPGR
jgi:2,2-dialkylglycine decarboxylase (pyruvate)